MSDVILGAIAATLAVGLLGMMLVGAVRADCVKPPARISVTGGAMMGLFCPEALHR